MTSIFKLPPVVGIALGVIFYEIGNTFLYMIWPLFFPTFFRLIGFVFIVYYLSRSSRQNLPGGVSAAFKVLAVWTVFMTIRGLIDLIVRDVSSYEVFRLSCLSQFGALAFFIPFFAIREFSLNDLYYLKRLAVIFCIVAVVFSLFFRKSISAGLLITGYSNTIGAGDEELSVRTLISAIFPGFGMIVLFLFCYRYIKGYVSLLFPIAIVVHFISSAIGGGRGSTTFSLVYLLSFFFLMIRYPLSVDTQSSLYKKSKFNGIWYFILGIAFVYLLWQLYNNTTLFDFVLQRAFGSKTLGTEIIDVNREILKDNMVSDFNAHPLAWIWGRGVYGTFKSSILDEGGMRQWIEWGYLYLVLKGGVVYFILIVYLMLHAAFMGFFRSNNALSKGLAMMCLMFLFNLVSTNSEPQFSSQFFCSWLCVALLEQSQIRETDDETLYGYFNDKSF